MVSALISMVTSFRTFKLQPHYEHVQSFWSKNKIHQHISTVWFSLSLFLTSTPTVLWLSFLHSISRWNRTEREGFHSPERERQSRRMEKRWAEERAKGFWVTLALEKARRHQHGHIPTPSSFFIFLHLFTYISPIRCRLTQLPAAALLPDHVPHIQFSSCWPTFCLLLMQ